MGTGITTFVTWGLAAIVVGILSELLDSYTAMVRLVDLLDC